MLNKESKHDLIKSVEAETELETELEIETLTIIHQDLRITLPISHGSPAILPTIHLTILFLPTTTQSLLHQLE